MAIEQRIFEEYQEVLHRPKMNIPLKLADSILDFIAFSSSWIDCNPFDFSHFEIIDPGGLPFAELALNTHAALITGNYKHFIFLRQIDVEVFQPGEFLSQFGQNFI